MKLLTGIVGTTLLAFTCVATSNVAMAGGHDVIKYQAKKIKRSNGYQYICKQSFHQLKGKWCFYKKKHNNKKMRNNNGQVRSCDSGLVLYKNDAEHYLCKRKGRAPFGYRPALVRGNIQKADFKFEEVEWFKHKGKKYAKCSGNQKILQKGNRVVCAAKAYRGWSGYRGLVWNGGNGANMAMQTGSGMAIQNRGGQYQYDNYRYMRNGIAACRKGKPTYDNSWGFHCK